MIEYYFLFVEYKGGFFTCMKEEIRSSYFRKWKVCKMIIKNNKKNQISIFDIFRVLVSFINDEELIYSLECNPSFSIERIVIYFCTLR